VSKITPAVSVLMVSLLQQNLLPIMCYQDFFTWKQQHPFISLGNQTLSFMLRGKGLEE
jgi:hypothetical protein